jgi:cytochrome c oxidase subunit 2
LHKAAAAGCFDCHAVDDAVRLAPSLHGLVGRDEVLRGGARVFVDAAYLSRALVDPGAEIVDGYDDTMPRYAGVLSPADVADLVAFIDSLRGPL